MVRRNKIIIGCKDQTKQNKASEIEEFLDLTIYCYIPGQRCQGSEKIQYKIQRQDNSQLNSPVGI